MRPLIAGNWKMHGLTGDAEHLAAGIRDGAAAAGAGAACDLLVCPPHTQIAAVARILAGSPVMLGGQDCHAGRQGPHTGDISADMLRDAGAGWVILGHSERRRDHGETDDMVRAKVRAARACGLTPIVCVGETEEQRALGRDTEVIGWQLAGSLPDDFTGVIAYEPVWAVGSGRTPDPGQMACMHRFIREELVREFGEAGKMTRVLYGGSVTPANAAAILAVPEVGGVLLGGASLEAGSFLAIARAVR